MAASTTLLTTKMTVIEESVEGRACGDPFQHRFKLAIDDALMKAPDANALVDVSFFFERFCIIARGAAVRVP